MVVFPKWYGGLAALALIVTGCKSYQAAPFDAEAFSREWQARPADSVQIAQAADQLRAAHPGPLPVTPFSLADGLSIEEAQVIALVYNPTLRVARLKAGVSKAQADHAGRWADPTIGIDAERIVSDVDEPWVVGGTLNLTLPISGRLEAEKKRAKAERAADLVRVAAEEWALRHRLHDTWSEWSMQARRIELLRALDARLDTLNRVVDRLSEAGSMTRIEARLFRMERATRQAELAAAESRLEELRLDLHAMLGLVPTATITLVPQAVPPQIASEGAHATASGFGIRVAAAEYEVAERLLQREIRGQYPDLGIGPGFGTDEGDERALLGLSIPLPLWNRNQQGVAEATAGRDLARAQLEVAVERHTSDVSAAQVRLASARRQRELMETVLTPAAEEHAADANRLAELGEINAVLLLDAFVRQHEANGRLLDAQLAEIRASSRLAELSGPLEIPQADGLGDGAKR